MPPLPSNPEITYARPGTEEFAQCIDALKAGNLAVTVLVNAGNPEPEHFFTEAKTSGFMAQFDVTAAAMKDNVLLPPFMHVAFFYPTHDAYAEAMDMETDTLPKVVEGTVEAVTISLTEPRTEPWRASRRRNWGRFLGLKGNDKE